jgi:glycosyltransferase involved in cell wall biosynthesis
MTLRVMQVLHQGGGAGSVTSTLHLSIGLAARGVHVRFVCPPGSEVEALARAAGLDVYPLRLRPRRRRANAQRLRELLTYSPVDLINSQSARDRQALTWLALTGRLPVPFVATRRQIPRTFFLENWVTSRCAARMIAVSRAVGDALVRRGTPSRKLAVIYNGLVAARLDVPVPASALDQWRERIGWEPHHRTIGIVARLKDHEVVLRALERVQTPVRLVLAGVEPLGRLLSLAATVPARHAVVTIPFTPDIRPLYELLELVLLPSRMEGLSQGLLEAMALGKPVIASSASGNVELVTDDVDGRLVPPDSPEAWAVAIEAMLRDATLARRLGANARDTARHRFTMEHTVTHTLELYRAVLGDAKFSTAMIPGPEGAVS